MGDGRYCSRIWNVNPPASPLYRLYSLHVYILYKSVHTNSSCGPNRIHEYTLQYTASPLRCISPVLQYCIRAGSVGMRGEGAWGGGGLCTPFSESWAVLVPGSAGTGRPYGRHPPSYKGNNTDAVRDTVIQGLTVCFINPRALILKLNPAKNIF